MGRGGADPDQLLQELDRLLERRAASQRRRVMEAAHRVDGRLTWDDVMNPDGHPGLRSSGRFQYEDGVLAGILAAQAAVRGRLREHGAAAEASPSEHDHDDGSVPYRYCPRCGGDLLLRRHVPHDPPRLTCGACRFVFYLDPKIATGVILGTGNGVVLARRSIEPRAGYWVFPSGYVDRGEPVEDAALREVQEEVGVHAVLDGLVGVYSYPGRPVVVVVFAGRMAGGDLVAGHETSEVRVYPLDRIPWEDLAFPSTRDALRDWLGGGGSSPPGTAARDGGGSGTRS